MNGTLDLLSTMVDDLSSENLDHNIIFCLPFPLLGYAFVKYSNIILGAQDCHEQEHGAFTGCTSAQMLNELNIRYVVLGHSERRLHCNETNPLIKQKAITAFQNGFFPILCVGESLDVYNKGDSTSFVANQVKELTSDLDFPYAIAYEPLWSIGSGILPKMHEIVEVINCVHEIAPDIKVYYGGSVNSANAFDIAHCKGLYGVLVGGASLKSDELISIVKAFDQVTQHSSN
ncbi:MAG: triose-phosphate isomerase [Candidatus Puniceispirillum sp.]|nr:triose-phosphate isomerase [Candidatus Puniceispirillum sp.]